MKIEKQEIEWLLKGEDEHSRDKMCRFICKQIVDRSDRGEIGLGEFKELLNDVLVYCEMVETIFDTINTQ